MTDLDRLLDNARGLRLYHRLVASKDFLEPIKAAGYWGTKPSSLEETRPSFRGTWIFQDPNSDHSATALSASSILIVVQVDWTDDGEGSYDKTDTKFFKLDPGKGGPRMNMDVHLLELGE